MKWTPNGEGPAPFSTKQREAMGVPPDAMAGQPAAPSGGTFGLGLGALIVVYFTNNWNVVIALQGVLSKLLGPIMGAAAAKQASRARATNAAQAAQARSARLSRMAVDAKKAK